MPGKYMEKDLRCDIDKIIGRQTRLTNLMVLWGSRERYVKTSRTCLRILLK